MLELIDRLLIRVEDLQGELESIVDELRELRAAAQGAPPRRGAPPMELRDPQPPLPSRSPVYPMEPPDVRDDWNEGRRAGDDGGGETFSGLLERSAWDSQRPAPDRAGEAPNLADRQPGHQPSAADPFEIIDDAPPRTNETAPLLARPPGMGVPPVEGLESSRRPTRRGRTRPPGSWAPAPNKVQRPRSSNRLEPQEDLAALLEGGEWAEEPSGQRPVPSRTERSQRRERSRGRGRPASEKGIESLLSGYLNEEET